jgi:RNA polymerase sigma-70 factor (ECF subfamily)
MIAEGAALVTRAFTAGSVGLYQLQAAIAALHATAPSVAETDFAQIAALYGVLAQVGPSAVVEINRAVATGRAHGPQAGLAVLAPVLDGGQLADYAPLHAAHADLLERAGDAEGAGAAWARAAACTENAVARTPLELRSAGTSARPRPSGPPARPR